MTRLHPVTVGPALMTDDVSGTPVDAGEARYEEGRPVRLDEAERAPVIPETLSTEDVDAAEAEAEAEGREEIPELVDDDTEVNTEEPVGPLLIRPAISARNTNAVAVLHTPWSCDRQM